MQVTYDGAHSLLIGNMITRVDDYGRTVLKYDSGYFFNTWDDFGLIPKSIPVIDPPDVQENTVEVPGSNGVVDLTEVLLGYPLYYNRSGSLEFYVDHTHPGYISWDVTYDNLLNTLHGFKKQIILTDSKGYYYDGRLKLNSWKSDKLASTISIDYNIAPYKMMLFSTYEDWLWDPFDFVFGTIPDKKGWYEKTVGPNTAIDRSYTVLGAIQMGMMPVVPDILIELVDGTPEDFDSLPASDKPKILFQTAQGRGAQTRVENDLEHGIGYVSYLRNDEQIDYNRSERMIGDSKKYIIHDPIISLGHPSSLGSNTYAYCGIRLINPRSYSIKMTIDFRQGRL